MQVSRAVIPPAPKAQKPGVKKGRGGGAKRTPRQMINNSAAVQ
jgi:hypothetical protein